MVEKRVAGRKGVDLSCVGGVCVTDDGRLEIHIRADDPACAALTKRLAERVIAGEATQYVFDKAPRDVGEAPAKARKS